MSAGAGTFAATGLVCAQKVRVGTFLNYGPKIAARICHVRYVSALGALAAFRCVSGEMLQRLLAIRFPRALTLQMPRTPGRRCQRCHKAYSISPKCRYNADSSAASCTASEVHTAMQFCFYQRRRPPGLRPAHGYPLCDGSCPSPESASPAPRTAKTSCKIIESRVA